MKKRFLLMLAAILVIATVTGCGGNDAPKAEEATVPKQEDVQEATETSSEELEETTTEESTIEETVDNGMETLISRFQGDWNGALIFAECTGIYEYLQDQWTSCIARFVIDEAGAVTPFIGLNVEDTPFTNLQAWLDTDMECMMLNGEWITVPFYETRITEYNGTINLEVYIENSGGSLCLVMNMRHVGDEGWTDEYPRLSTENIEYCRGMSFDELAVLNGYEAGDYPEAEGSTGGAATSVPTADLAEKEHNDLEIKTARAEGLRDCRKLMTLAKAGKYNGYLLEGMGCPGGCVAGPGTILPVEKAAKFVEKYSKEAITTSPTDSPFRHVGEELD